MVQTLIKEQPEKNKKNRKPKLPIYCLFIVTTHHFSGIKRCHFLAKSLCWYAQAHTFLCTSQPCERTNLFPFSRCRYCCIFVAAVFFIICWKEKRKRNRPTLSQPHRKQYRNLNNLLFSFGNGIFIEKI